MHTLVQNTFAEPNDPGALGGDPLVIHLRSEPTRNRVLTIFVHGLGGSRYGRGATWGFFPQFVFEDFSGVDVGLYQYRTLLGRLKFWESIDLSDEATVFANLIRDVALYEVVILVGHSMGGLLCEAAIESLIDTGEEQVLQRIGGMILMASPQTGSQRVPSFLSFFSKDAHALRPHSAYVTGLQRTLTNRLWLEFGSPPPTGPPTRYQVPAWAILGSSDFWVDKLSASLHLPNLQTKMIRGSHTQIVKPSSKEHDGYTYVCGCIDKIVKRSSASAEAQQRAEERKIAPWIPSRIPAVGIFFDRREILARIVEFLNDPIRRIMVIAGLPGIGKSTLAAKVVQESPLPFKDVFWMTCTRESATVDWVLGQIHSFLEKNGDGSLRGLWNAPRADLLQDKIDALVDALKRNMYLLIFDEFALWLDEQCQVKNPGLRLVLNGLVSSAHRSKILLIAERKPFFDPQSSPIPPGVMQSEELFGLEEADGIELLKRYLPHEDENLLRTIVQTCGASPRLIIWFGYRVAEGRQDPKELLASEGVELFWKLLNGVVEDLTEEGREALERLSIFRRPLTKRDLKDLGVSFQKAVVPLLDRYLATSYDQDNSVSVAEPVKTSVRARLVPERLRRLHLEAVGFYAAKQSAAQPSTLRDVLPVLEKAYHLAGSGRGQESADAVLGVTKPLTEWGYLDLVQQEVGRVLEATGLDMLRWARCKWTLADVQDLRSEYPAALDLLEEALRAFETVQDYEGVARCRWRMGRVRNALGDFSRALEDFGVCIEICDQRKVTGPKAAALLDKGWTLAQRGNLEEALALMELSLELATNSQDFGTQASASRQIGWISWKYRRETQKSRDCYQRSLEIATRYGLRKELGAVHGDLGYLYIQWGDSQAAEKSCRDSIKIREDLGDHHGLAEAHVNLGLVLHSRKEYSEGTRCFNESLRIYRRLKAPRGEAWALLHQGIAWRETGTEFNESEKALKQALEIVRSHDLKLMLAEVLHELGKTLLLAGRKEEARTWLASAVEEAGKINSRSAEEYAQFLKTASN